VALYSVCTSGYNNYVERTVIATGATSSLFDSGYDGQITIGPDGNIYMTTGNYDGGLFEFNVATGSFTSTCPVPHSPAASASSASPSTPTICGW